MYIEPYILIPMVLGLFGVIIGSFLNVVIYRLHSKSIGGRSKCMSCGKVLTWRELIPVVSFFAQKGRCIKCKSRLSWQYPLVELGTGILAVLVAIRFIPGTYVSIAALATFLFFLTICSVLMVITVYDIRHKIIPDRFVFIFIGLSIVNIFLVKNGLWQFGMPAMEDLLAGLVLPLPFALIFLISRGRLIGFGDVKLMSGIGFLLGMSTGLVSIMVSFWLGAIIGIGLLLLRGRNFTMKTEIPFGPFLIFGTLLGIFVPIGLTSLFLLTGAFFQ